MGKQDTFTNDLEAQLNVNIQAEDGIEDAIDIVLSSEFESISDLVKEQFGQYVEPEIVEALIEAYEIDIYKEPELVARAVYSTYMKEYG